ncbi:MAG TPA: tyrosine-type recombinase/integrase [Cytophagaceae bacterium]|jgi:integrase/recombinase XerD|nr:tyrosine-type recombinase/integrase [Cytophagaceae bacterium]
MKHLPIYNSEFERLLKDFSDFIDTKGYSVGSKDRYPSCVREFLFFAENKGITIISAVETLDLYEYYDYLQQRPNQNKEGTLSDSSIRTHLLSIQMFFDFLLDIGEIENTPASLPKFNLAKGKERNIVTLEEITQIYKACELKRDRALISIAYGCGLRRTEIYRLNLSDVSLSKGILTVRRGKGDKSRTIPLSDNVLKDLKEYVIYERPKYFIHCRKDPSHAFLVGNVGKRIGIESLNKRVKQIIERTKNFKLLQKEITLHCLRHSIATHLIDKGASIEFVQIFLGHAEIDTTHIYSKKRKQQMKVMQMVSRYERTNL